MIMITGAIVGALICGLFPLLFVPVFRRLEAQRTAVGSKKVGFENLRELESEARTLEAEVREAEKERVAD
jgi:hypothetical protein